MEKQYQDAVETLQEATRALSGVCDGATSIDGTGFNGLDTHFGKSLAAQARWSPKQAVAAQKMLRKYTKQLSGFGIDISLLPQLEVEKLQADKERRPRMNNLHYNPATDAFEFYFDYDFEQKEYVKRELRAFFHGDTPAYWNLRLERANVDGVLGYIEKYRPAVSPEAQSKLADLQKGAELQDIAQTALAELSKAEDADLSRYNMTGFEMVPYNFQKAGALYGLLRRKSLIGDDMGLGKTIQALLIAHLSGAADKGFIVLCPASVKLNWKREIERAMPRLAGRVDVWDGQTKPCPGFRLSTGAIIINYDNLKKQLKHLIAYGPAMIIIDEIHYLKSATAQRTKAAQELITATGAEYIAALTGTPILNRPVELVAPLTLLGYMDSFGGYWEFVKRYCDAHPEFIWVKRKGGAPFQKKIWKTDGAKNLNELNTRLRQICMVRRRKLDVLKDMPAKQRAQIAFPLSNRKEYDEAANNLISYLRASAAADKAFLAQVKDLPEAERRAAILKHQEEAAESAEAAQHLVMIETLKQLSAEGKMDAACEWIEDFLESGEKLVIFATHVAVQRKLVESLARRFEAKKLANPCAHIFAEDSVEQRQAAVERFQRDETCRLMVCSLIAGGQGVDGMQNVCSNVAFMEMGWAPAHHLQAEDRLQRIGQDSQVTCYYMVAEHTIEEDIQALLASKQAVCDSVLDGAEEARSGSIFNELVAIMAQR